MSIISPLMLFLFYPELHFTFGSLMNYQLPMMDIYTNFVCVILTYGPFTKQYTKICGCCDKKCKSCLFKMITNAAAPPNERRWTIPSLSISTITNSTRSLMSRSGMDSPRSPRSPDDFNDYNLDIVEEDIIDEDK